MLQKHKDVEKSMVSGCPVSLSLEAACKILIFMESPKAAILDALWGRTGTFQYALMRRRPSFRGLADGDEGYDSGCRPSMP